MRRREAGDGESGKRYNFNVVYKKPQENNQTSLLLLKITAKVKQKRCRRGEEEVEGGDGCGCLSPKKGLINAH